MKTWKEKITRYTNKHGKGQVLVILALVFIGLIAVIGLAIDLGYMYVSYANLRRSVDAAALSSTAQFKKDATNQQIVDAAQQFLDLNAVKNLTDFTVEGCDFKYDINATPKMTSTAGTDPTLCTDPPRKLIRVTASENVPTFFISVMGIHSLPITVSSTSEAASLEVVLVIDRSESMAWYKPNLTDKYPSGSLNGDPQECNPNDCHPFQEVKDAAKSFVQYYIYPPYDRVAIVTFDQKPQEVLSLTGDQATILNAIDSLTVYPALGACDNAANFSQPGPNYDWAHPPASGWDAGGPCRLYTVDPWPGGSKTNYWWYDCPNEYSSPPNFSDCESTNIGGGLQYASYIFTHEDVRQQALWVTILLTDGVPNAGYDQNGNPICPGNEKSNVPYCRDNNALVRHCASDWSTTNPDCDTQATQDLSNQVTQAEIGKNSTIYVDKNTGEDALNYDADDYARDQADILNTGAHSLIFAIGLGPEVTNANSNVTAPGTPPAGSTLLNYIAARGQTDNYFQGSASDLQNIFLAIANRIATRLTQ